MKNCAMDPLTGLCSGCGRNLDEIGAWLNLSVQERRRIMAELPDRMEKGRMKKLKPD